MSGSWRLNSRWYPKSGSRTLSARSSWRRTAGSSASTRISRRVRSWSRWSLGRAEDPASAAPTASFAGLIEEILASDVAPARLLFRTSSTIPVLLRATDRPGREPREHRVRRPAGARDDPAGPPSRHPRVFRGCGVVRESRDAPSGDSGLRPRRGAGDVLCIRALGCKLARRYADRITIDFFGDQLVCHLAEEPADRDGELNLYPRHFGVLPWWRLRCAVRTLACSARSSSSPTCAHAVRGLVEVPADVRAPVPHGQPRRVQAQRRPAEDVLIQAVASKSSGAAVSSTEIAASLRSGGDLPLCDVIRAQSVTLGERTPSSMP